MGTLRVLVSTGLVWYLIVAISSDRLGRPHACSPNTGGTEAKNTKPKTPLCQRKTRTKTTHRNAYQVLPSSLEANESVRNLLFASAEALVPLTTKWQAFGIQGAHSENSEMYDTLFVPP